MDKLMQGMAERAQAHLQTRWAGTIIVAGKSYQCAVVHDTVDVEAGRDRWVKKRRITVSVNKTLMPDMPEIGSKVTEDGITYKVESYIHPESFAFNRGFTGIQTDK